MTHAATQASNAPTARAVEIREVSIGRPGEPVTDWRPWIKCSTADTLEQTALLAIHAHMRTAGYLGGRPGAPAAVFEPFDLMVYVATPADPRHANGRPLVCHGFRMTVSPRDEVQP